MTKHMWSNRLIVIIAVATFIGILYLAIDQVNKLGEPYYTSYISCAEEHNFYEVYTGVFWPELGGKIWNAIEIVDGKDTVKTLKKQETEAEKILKEIYDHRMLE